MGAGTNRFTSCLVDGPDSRLRRSSRDSVVITRRCNQPLTRLLRIGALEPKALAQYDEKLDTADVGEGETALKDLKIK